MTTDILTVLGRIQTNPVPVNLGLGVSNVLSVVGPQTSNTDPDIYKRLNKVLLALRNVDADTLTTWSNWAANNPNQGYSALPYVNAPNILTWFHNVGVDF